MNYFQAYLPSLDEAIVAAWDSQVAEAADIPSLAQALTAKTADLFPRFADAYAQLRALPRGARRALQRQLARSAELTEILPGRALQRKLAGSLAGAALLLALGQGTAQAAIINVTTNIPRINPADGSCSLIEAIVNANDDAQTHADCAKGIGADEIVLQAGTVHKLTRIDNNVPAYGPTGLPIISSNITITGNGATIRRSGTAPTFRIFTVIGTGDLTLENVTVSGGGRPSLNGGGVYNYQGTVTISNSTISGNRGRYGGGVHNASGELNVSNSTISGNNRASRNGGGVLNDQGTVTISNSTISGNRGRYGGGVHNASGELNVSDSTISGNRASRGGGGVATGGANSTVTIANSTISGNTAANEDGGGIFNGDYATMTISSSTISGNSASFGGGIRTNFYSTLTIESSTISGNKAGSGGGFHNEDYASTTITNSTISGNTATGHFGGGGIANDGILSLNRSLISGNTARRPTLGPEVYQYSGTVTAANFNIFGVSNNPGITNRPVATPFNPGATDIVPAVPLASIVDPLADNGGPTYTHALPTGSPAIDAAPTGGSCPATDQRGAPYSRPVGPLCDIGAYEKQ